MNLTFQIVECDRRGLRKDFTVSRFRRFINNFVCDNFRMNRKEESIAELFDTSFRLNILQSFEFGSRKYDLSNDDFRLSRLNYRKKSIFFYLNSIIYSRSSNCMPI